jgi:hypothetical protein
MRRERKTGPFMKGVCKDGSRWGGAVTAWLRDRQWIALLALAILAAVALGVVLSMLLARSAAPLMDQAARLPDAKDSLTAQKDILQYQTDNQLKIWTAIVQALGAVVLAVGGYFTWRSLRLGQENLRATEKRLDIDREAQITNRFTQAIGQVGAELKNGKPNLEVRLGGIFALERLSRDSPRDYWVIIEVLTAYVRQNAKREPATAPIDSKDRAARLDIQAILTVLGRRTLPTEFIEPFPLDLRDTQIRGVYLTGANLQGVYLTGANLQVANLMNANLRGAYLINTNLRSAYLTDAYVQGANLLRASLQDAHLGRANLQGASLTGANLQGANLCLTDLAGADLSTSIGLSQEQLQRAIRDITTKLPGNLHAPPIPTPVDR